MSAAETSPDRLPGVADVPLAPDAYLSTGPIALPRPRSDAGVTVAIERATASDAELARAATGDGGVRCDL